MADKSPREKMRNIENALEDKNTIELEMRRPGKLGRAIDKLTGTSYLGTSLGPGAAYAEKEASDRAWKQGKSISEMEPEVRKAMREAAAQERRETRQPFAKGGSVGSASKRADGCAQRGKTKGRMI